MSCRSTCNQIADEGTPVLPWSQARDSPVKHKSPNLWIPSGHLVIKRCNGKSPKHGGFWWMTIIYKWVIFQLTNVFDVLAACIQSGGSCHLQYLEDSTGSFDGAMCSAAVPLGLDSSRPHMAPSRPATLPGPAGAFLWFATPAPHRCRPQWEGRWTG